MKSFSVQKAQMTPCCESVNPTQCETDIAESKIVMQKNPEPATFLAKC
jgi:hypothetical protein